MLVVLVWCATLKNRKLTKRETHFLSLLYELNFHRQATLAIHINNMSTNQVIFNLVEMRS